MNGIVAVQIFQVSHCPDDVLLYAVHGLDAAIPLGFTIADKSTRGCDSDDGTKNKHPDSFTSLPIPEPSNGASCVNNYTGYFLCKFISFRQSV